MDELDEIIKSFFEQRDRTGEKLSFPGHYDLVKLDSMLSSIGYQGYSINYIHDSNGMPCTQVILRNTL